MNFMNQFYFDGFLRELGEATEEMSDQDDCVLMKKMERRLLAELDKERKLLFLNFVDASRREMMRGEGKAYMMGFLMGVQMGGTYESQQKEE